MNRSVGYATVLSGLPGDVEHADDGKDHRVGKVGGQAVLPGAKLPAGLAAERIVCRDCGKVLVLVAQVR